ncbi:DUF485 domain-containing protein [Viridibacillus sp. FSL R5-0477]|uniref:DUF485 domain-containing protein n=1 Tax=Viridibacillus arenosi FSL R5-213 TaxID=1227360 RepID=W4F1K5_9BACL|nr:DUF485 domain-containing protein [Viridibacillus arenosi]ETT86334.1 hypothetical protein C176_06467 [Viridibacillus arenosi FSL R5-213]
MDQKLESVLQGVKNSDSSEKTSKKRDKEITADAYVAIAESQDFKKLVKKKNSFIVPVSIFFILFYFTLPVLTSFTTVLNVKVIGDITMVWIFAFAQFIMTWILCMTYVSKANKFDKEAESIIEKVKDGEY